MHFRGLHGVAVLLDERHRLCGELRCHRGLQCRISRGLLGESGVSVGADDVLLSPCEWNRHGERHCGEQPQQHRGGESHRYLATRRGPLSAIFVIIRFIRDSALSELW